MEKISPAQKAGTLDAAQLSVILGISESTVKRLARNKEIPCEHEKKRPRFRLEALLDYFERLEGGAA